MVDPPIFAPSSLPDAAVYRGTRGIGYNLHNPGIPALCPAPAYADSFIIIVRCKDQLSIFLCSLPNRRPPTNRLWTSRSLPDATAPKGSEDRQKGYNVRNPDISTQCPALAGIPSITSSDAKISDFWP
ncbi:hypothetical protein THAOC_08221 [Thalassiosira oceanica]|uniref:Uncharacterized protein n=1 Tax=Thalassiosira oceanica TaxID=159749 RepID=K0SVI0_THAOC|nr:hypothetical protein THAOC_08221 [Thalassiosira oceanica]|eukprot:EJK70423.1 hypothetical protein THAOC_08221 [Thalassiosira oceanica]